MIQIDKNVPMPPSPKGNTRYPWKDMAVGDSFYVSKKPSQLSSIIREAQNHLEGIEDYVREKVNAGNTPSPHLHS